jgi:hypothetical protein
MMCDIMSFSSQQLLGVRADSLPQPLLQSGFPEGLTLSFAMSEMELPFKSKQIKVPDGLYELCSVYNVL